MKRLPFAMALLRRSAAAALLALPISLGCTAFMKKDPETQLGESYGVERARLVVKMREAGARARANPDDPHAASAYAKSIVDALKKHSEQVKEEDWVARSREAADMAERAADRLAADEAYDALTYAFALDQSLADKPAQFRTGCAMYKKKVTWESSYTCLGAHAYIEKKQSDEGKQVCQSTYRLANDEQRSIREFVEVVRMCLNVVPGAGGDKTLEESLPFMHPTHIAQFRSEIDRRGQAAVDELRRPKPCLYNPRDDRYEECLSFSVGKCHAFGMTCSKMR
jgi:hypothetical protein